MLEFFRPTCTLPDSYGLFGQIVQSWFSIKTWVKYWLFYLNGIFLASLIFWPRPDARLIFYGYLASAPFLIGLMVFQRGLTRLLGLAHLIPWMPLLVILLYRLTTGADEHLSSPETFPIYHIYLWTVIVSIAICLIFDLVDVRRWIKGERYVLGTRAAAEQNASYCCKD